MTSYDRTRWIDRAFAFLLLVVAALVVVSELRNPVWFPY